MNPTEAKQDEILSAIGLKRNMEWYEEENNSIYDGSKFRNYVSKEYRNSERKESDEFYRMFEFNLIHKATGIRITYSTSEGYFGDRVDYSLMKIFIITRDGERLNLLDVDFEKKIFITPDKEIQFSDISWRDE